MAKKSGPQRILCAHADENGEGAHWKLEGEPCPAPESGPRARTESWMDEDGVHVWVRHECLDGVEEFMLPNPPWRSIGLSPAVEPSFSCTACGDHEFLWLDSVG